MMNNRHIKIGLVFIGICMIVGLVLAYLSVPHEKLNVSDTPTASSPTSAASAMPAGNVAGPQQKEADIIITDALLASQKTLDQLNRDTPLTVCLGNPVMLSNASKRSVQLATTPPEGADGPEDIQTLGAVRPGEIFRFSPTAVSEFNITEVDGGFLARVHVNQCGGAAATSPERQHLKPSQDALNAQAPQGDSNVSNSIATRFGTLSILGDAPDQNVAINGRNLYQGTTLSLKQKFEIGDRDIVLIEDDSGGTACPASFVIFDLSAGGASATPSFGTCTDTFAAKATSTGITVSMAGYQSAESHTRPGQAHIFAYSNGKLTDNGKPVRM